jgi:FMN phosphatase YigB (HAD superfamily)
VQVFSCDVFDTVLTRAVGRPRSVFLLLGMGLRARGLIRCGPAAFMHARQEAAGRAHANCGPHYTLRQSYDELEAALGLSAAEGAAIMAAEIELERSLIRAIPGARERLERARAAGARTVFLCDMYVDAGFITDQLARHGISAAGDVCYVSCETGSGKSDGSAYRMLARREAVTASCILHRGNDVDGDVRSARRAGVAVEPYFDANPNRYEDLLEDHASATEGLSSVLAGASRMARLSVTVTTPREAALRDVAAGVAAPALVSYVLWILLQCRSRGVHRLYFLARDGYIMMRIAERLLPKLGMECELRYLHGGRRSWLMASVTAVTPADLFWAVDYASPQQTLHTFLGRIGVHPEEVAGPLDDIGMPRSAWDRTCALGEQDRLWTVLEHPQIRTLVLERAGDHARMTRAYFEQEGLFEASPWAAVDIGWSGRVLGAMQSVLRRHGGDLPDAFFFARFRDAETHTLEHPPAIMAYFADYDLQRGYTHRFPELLLELFCGADHGTTLSYREEAGRIVPVLAGESNAALSAWGLDVVHRTIESFVDELWLQEDAVNVMADVRPAIADVCRAFVQHPTRGEAEAWGSYPFEYGRSGTATAPIAPRLSLVHASGALRRGWITTRPGTEWVEGGLALAPPLTRFIIKLAFYSRRRLRAAWRRAKNLLTE